MRGIGSHTKPNNGESEIWLTPPEILSALGPFDLDPCAAPTPRPWPTAAAMIELPDDGLAATWKGRVWLNPPYTQKMNQWMQKMAFHHNGIALTFARTETSCWQQWIWPYAAGILFIAGRLRFCRPDGTTPTETNAGGPSALIAYSNADAHCLMNCGIKGRFVRDNYEVIAPTPQLSLLEAV